MTYARPKDLSEALALLADAPGQIVAGGTDVYPASKRGVAPAYYLDVTRLDGFKDLTHGDEGTWIGAAVTWRDLIRAKLPAAFDGLKAAAREVGSVQIQNAGTLVGNICNASPAADGVPALLTLDASVEIASASRGRRVVGLSEFVTGVRQTALAPDELVVGLRIPAQHRQAVSAFEKLGSRTYLVISISMTAVKLVLDDDGRVVDAALAVGACSAVAQRLPALEQALIGKRPEAVVILAEHLAPLDPIDDVRGSKAYRLEAVGAQCARLLQKVARA